MSRYFRTTWLGLGSEKWKFLKMRKLPKFRKSKKSQLGKDAKFFENSETTLRLIVEIPYRVGTYLNLFRGRNNFAAHRRQKSLWQVWIASRLSNRNAIRYFQILGERARVLDVGTACIGVERFFRVGKFPRFIRGGNNFRK